MITQNEIIEMAKKFLPKSDVSEILFGDDAGSGRMTAMLLYLLILQNDCKKIIEFSPGTGFSSVAMALAMKRLGYKNSFLTFEINLKRKEKFEDRINKLDLNDYVKCIWGDALHRIPSSLAEKQWDVDFCFVDSGHTKEFSRRYTQEIFPLLNDNSIICIHDISAKSLETNMYGEHADEWIGVKEWVVKNNIKYELTHAIFGGIEERSKHLPINTKLYSIFDNLLNVNFVKNDSKQPMMLVARNT